MFQLGRRMGGSLCQRRRLGRRRPAGRAATLRRRDRDRRPSWQCAGPGRRTGTALPGLKTAPRPSSGRPSVSQVHWTCSSLRGILLTLSPVLSEPHSATDHYNFSTWRSFSRAAHGIKLNTGLVSVRRSTKGIQPQDGRTGFGAPHVKPPVRPSLFSAPAPSCCGSAAQRIFS